jgi:CRP/FNR family transcriptional regulator, anaerobic regulatory protein
MDSPVFQRLHQSSCRSVCSSCNLREICLPVGLTKLELDYVDRHLVADRRKVPRGGYLYRAGDRFESLHAVWTGSFKTCLSTADGREQVTGFQLCGELLGLDGIDSRLHGFDAVALEDSRVCVIRFEDLEDLTQEVSSLQQQFHRAMSREIVRTHGAMLLLGSLYAEERLAAFLLNLANRLQARGFSGTAVSLRMSREEIASFLGLTLGTISRSFTKLQDQGLLFVRNRQIQITDPLGLQQLLDGAPS